MSDNTEQARFWNEEGGAAWVALQDRMDRQLEPLGLVGLKVADAKAGEHVLDVGCGCGGTTLLLAAAVGTRGSVRGVDISAPMAAVANERAAKAGYAHMQVEVLDAQTAELPSGEYDLVFSRFGVMFFADSGAAFANIRSSVKPGGRLTFVCWQKPSLNDCLSISARALVEVLPPQPPVDPLAPGPFAFADPDRVMSILTDAGWTGVAVQPHEQLLQVGGVTDFDATVELSMRIGPASRALANFPDLREPARRAIADAFRPHFQPEKGVMLGSAVWVVTARN